MDLVPDLQAWLQQQEGNGPDHIEVIEGGCISQAFCVSQGNEHWFIKQKVSAPDHFFEAEAEGLNYLHTSGNVNTPEVLQVGEQYIVMRYIEPSAQRANFWDLLAEQLALLHDCTRLEFGFFNDNFCGETPQINTFSSSGFHFYRENRFRFQAQRALAARLLEAKDYQDVLSIADRLPQLVPQQPASLLHGDLWSGNVHVSDEGEPVFIDPAVYFGWAESDLAMTSLFGGFPERFYDVYLATRALEPGWRERIPIYNLYHLLNHLNLFGEGYFPAVRKILDRFA